jgi:hypothetical protein
VVRVAVTTVVVVHRQNVRRLFLEDGRQARCCVIHRGGGERSAVAVRGVTVHSGVAVPEELHAVNAEQLRRRLRLDRPDVGER